MVAAILANSLLIWIGSILLGSILAAVIAAFVMPGGEEKEE